MRAMGRFYARTLVRSTLLLSTLLASTRGIQLSIGVEHDLSQPTYGLQGRSSSQMSYDERNGLQLAGTIGDILGPPVKIANGFGKMLAGSGLAGAGSSLKSGNAVLAIEPKMLEAAGGASMLKGGLLMGGAAAKVGAAKLAGGLPGKKIASIIELPVKVVAMKDLAKGKGLVGLGRAKQQQAQQERAKGDTMVRDGQALKSEGMRQVMQGASEGVQNFGNMVQQTAENAANAFKFLPILMDLPTPDSSSTSAAGTKGEHQVQQQQQQEHEQLLAPHHHSAQTATHAKAGSLTGGSLFGGLGSLVPALSGGGGASGATFGSTTTAADTAAAHQQPLENLFAPFMNHNGYAAVLNATNPFTSFIMNPRTNPLLLPFSVGNSLLESAPLGQSIGSKSSSMAAGASKSASASAAAASSHGSTNHYNYNLLPGLKISETMSSSGPQLAEGKISASPLRVHQQQQQQHEQSTDAATKH